MRSTSPLWEQVKPRELAPLTHDQTTDVCVIGGGIAGLSVAYQLAREGVRVILLDDGPLGGGQTVLTTAHLASAIDDRYVEIERRHGVRGARLAAESHAQAIDAIEQTAKDEGIECDFCRLDGYLFLPPHGDRQLLEAEFEAAQRTAALQLDWANRAPLAIDTGPCIVFHRQGQFHPLKYLAGLAEALVRLGGQAFEAHAEQINGGVPAKVRCRGGHVIQAESVVVATNSPVNDRFAMHTKQSAYLSYVVAAPVPHGSVEQALYWDTEDPYHYVRLQALDAATEMLIVGGEDHKTGQATDHEERFARLEDWARQRFPSMGAVKHRWSGQVLETFDGLAFIGRNPSDDVNVFIATGDSGMGMTHGTIAGLLLTDLIQGRQNPWETLYNPARVLTGSLKEFVTENLNVARQYVDLVGPGDVSDVREIAPGSGAVVRRGLKKIAAFRADDGSLTECSAICPHLGCVVAWNQAEQTWDCPCHGSRFATDGRVINGPANSDLPKNGNSAPQAAEKQQAHA